LFQDAIQCSRRELVVHVARDRDPAWLGRMLELLVASLLSDQIPAILLDQLDGIFDFYAFDRIYLLAI
jgi:hypothetical protein